MSGAKTRIVHLIGGQSRQDASNVNTRIAVFERDVVPHSFRSLFISHYEEIRDECLSFGKPGLAVVAVDRLRGTLAGSLCIAAKIGSANSAIIGRHGMADLYLDGDAALSLRHLVVIVSPLRENEDVRFKIVDLRTSSGFHDEHGKRFEAVLVEGPLFIRCGSYFLYCLPTGDTSDWPVSAEDGWECIPERVYLRGAEAEPDRWERSKARKVKRRGAPFIDVGEDDENDRGAITLVHSVAGPVRARARLLEPGESPMGTLRISSEAGIQSLILGPRAAQQGILLGRYQRCDIDGVNVLIHDSISRVHLLIIAIDEELYAIDAASTHGTWLRKDAREVRIAKLEAGTEIMLGEDLAVLRWSPA